MHPSGKVWDSEVGMACPHIKEPVFAKTTKVREWVRSYTSPLCSQTTLANPVFAKTKKVRKWVGSYRDHTVIGNVLYNGVWLACRSFPHTCGVLAIKAVF